MKVNIKEPKFLYYVNGEYIEEISRNDLIEKLDKVGLRIYQDNQAKGWEDKIYIDENSYVKIKDEEDFAYKVVGTFRKIENSINKETLAEIIIRELMFPVSSLKYNNSDLLVLSDNYSTVERYLEKKNIKYIRYISDIEGNEWYNKIIIKISF